MGDFNGVHYFGGNLVMVKLIGVNPRGLRDWIVQRLTALYMGGYVVFLSTYLLLTRPVTFTGWSALFSTWPMKVATVLCLLGVMVHAWIGMWTILTDYVKFKMLRAWLCVAVLFFLAACFLWGILILWSV